MARGRPRSVYRDPIGDRMVSLNYFYQHQRPGPNGCIEWTGCFNNIGYPFIGFRKISTDKKGMMSAHRLALMIKLGREIAPGMNANHTCHNRGCLNPNHLYEGTQQQKLIQMMVDQKFPLSQGRPRQPRDINSYQHTVEEIQWGRRATLDEIQQKFQCDRIRAYRYRYNFRNNYRRVPDQ